MRSIVDGREQDDSRPSLPAPPHDRPWLTIPLETPDGYAPNDASVGDLDGDGEYEIVLQQAGRGRDNSQPGLTEPPLLEVYEYSTFLAQSCAAVVAR